MQSINVRDTAYELGMKELFVKAQKQKIFRRLSDIKMETEKDNDHDEEASAVVDNFVPLFVASEVDHQICKDVIFTMLEKNLWKEDLVLTYMKVMQPILMTRLIRRGDRAVNF